MPEPPATMAVSGAGSAGDRAWQRSAMPELLVTSSSSATKRTS